MAPRNCGRSVAVIQEIETTSSAPNGMPLTWLTGVTEILVGESRAPPLESRGARASMVTAIATGLSRRSRFRLTGTAPA
jgi:hypothetical protein